MQPVGGRARWQTGGMIPGTSPTKGRLLVATPPLEDANFDRTVIFVLEHHDEGAIGVVINRPSYEALDEPLDRWIDLHWTDGRHAPVHNVTVDVTMSNEKGVLGRICTLIGEQNANISDLHFMDRKPDFYRLLIDLDVRDAEHLHAVMMAVEADSDVATVQRFRDLDRRP